MPPQSKVTVEEAVSVLQNYEQICSDNSLPAYSHPVWRTISKDLEGKWTPHVVYINVRENRREIITKTRDRLELQTILEPEIDGKNGNVSLETSNETSATSIESLDISSDKLQVTTFSLNLRHELWLKIKPDLTVYNNRTYCILKPGVWSDIVSDEFWRQFRLPCAYVFKRAKVYFSDHRKHYIVIHGKCKSEKCSSRFFGYCDDEPAEGEDVIIQVETADTTGTVHETVKRQVRNAKRQVVGKQLLTEGASNWRRRTAKEEMHVGDVEPPLLYESHVLRKLKQECRDKELGIHTSDVKDPVTVIRKMKHTTPYAGSIHEISGDKFSVHYRSHAQMHVYKEYCRWKTNNSTISIDATGSLVSKLSVTDDLKSGHIFLYEVVINFDGNTVSVNQMLCEKQDTNAIEYWLKEWLRAGAPVPAETVCDYSRALLGALTSTFNRMSIKQYVQACFSATYLQNKDDLLRPANVYIRIDVAHLISLVCRWKCFDKNRPAIKNFFVRCVALMVNCQTFEKFEEILLLTLTVAIHEYDGNVGNSLVTSPAEAARITLEEYIATESHNFDPNLDFETQRVTGRRSSDCDLPDSPAATHSDQIDDWIGKLQKQAEADKGQQASRLNAYYLPEFYKQIIRLAKEFPLWTAVLTPNFESNHLRATSCYVEGDFNELKSRILKGIERPIRVDKFLKIHLSSLEGSAKISSAKIIRTNMTASEDTAVDMKHIENWRNKASYDEVESSTATEPPNDVKTANHVEEKKRKSATNKSYAANKKSKYFKPCPEIKHASVSLATKHKKCLLKNGSGLAPVVINKQAYQICNTCCFDSIVQILAIGAMENKKYHDVMKDSVNGASKFVLSFMKKGPTAGVYKERGVLLKMLFPPSDEDIEAASIIARVDAYTNIARMWEQLMDSEPSAYRKQECSSEICGDDVKPVHTIYVNHNIIAEKTFEYLEKAVVLECHVINKKCQNLTCSGRRTESVQLNSHIFIELDIRSSVDSKTGMAATLDNFPIHLNIRNEEYRHVGTEFFGSVSFDGENAKLFGCCSVRIEQPSLV